MSNQGFSTDLSDGEWEILSPVLQPSTLHGRPRKYDRWLVLNAVFYLVRGGLPWRLLPGEFPPWRSVYEQFTR